MKGLGRVGLIVRRSFATGERYVENGRNIKGRFSHQFFRGKSISRVMLKKPFIHDKELQVLSIVGFLLSLYYAFIFCR